MLRPANHVKPEPVRWLWRGRIARGKLTLFSGDAGDGKSLLTADITSRVSRGSEWPDGQPCPKGEAMIFNSEDDAGDTVVPRLMAAQANLERVQLFEGVRQANGKRGMFDLGRDLPLLEEAMLLRPALQLVIIDPLGLYSGGLDINAYNQMYSLLGPLNELAARYAIAVVVVMHMNKAVSMSAKYRTAGSTAIVGACRCAWTVLRDPDDDERRRRLFLPTKQNNTADDDTGMAFRIVADSDSEIARIEWCSEVVEMTADEALERLNEHRGAQTRRHDQSAASVFLSEILRDGPKDSTVIEREAKQAGTSFRACHRHKDELGIVVRRVGGVGDKGNWRWYLPEHLDKAETPQN